MGQSESVLLTPALVPCWLGRAMPQAEPSSCASSAATAATFPLLSRTVTPLPAAQCCPAELWWEEKKGPGGLPLPPTAPQSCSPRLPGQGRDRRQLLKAVLGLGHIPAQQHLQPELLDPPLVLSGELETTEQ